MTGLNILPRLSEYLEGIFGRKRDLVSIEMGENFIKLAEIASSHGKREVARLVKRPLSPETAVEDIKKIFESLNISHHQIRLNIPRHLVTVRFLTLPSTDDNEIKKMARMESLKHIPYADEDVVSGCRIIEKQDDGYSKILIAVTQADTVRNQLSVLKRAGISVESVSLGSETLLLWYLASRTSEENITILLANIEAGHVDIDIIAGDNLIFTRGVLFSLVSPISTEKIIEQITLSIAAYRKESARPIDKVILTGVSANANALKTVLEDSVKCPIEMIDQLNNIAKRDSPDLEQEDASFVELLGLALRHEGAQINLLPETTQEEYRIDLVKKNVMAGLVIAGLIIVMAFGLILKKIHDKHLYITYIDVELAKIEPQVKTAKKMAKEIEIITSKIAERPLAIDLVSEVFRITPSGVTLTMMEYESRKTVTLRGTAPSLSDIFNYVATLEKSPYFKNVKVKYANKRTGQSQNTADFEIICPISKPW